MTMTRRATLLSLTGAAFAGSVSAVGAQTPKPDARPVINHLLAPASPGGSYFPAGVALSTVIRIMLEPDAGVTLSAITTAGSIETLKLLREQEVGFAFPRVCSAFSTTGDSARSRNLAPMTACARSPRSSPMSSI